MISTSQAEKHENPDRKAASTPVSTPSSIYVHIPFCTHKCQFCDFAAFAGLSHMEDEYTNVLCSELAKRLDLATLKQKDKPQIETIFFGGGTPGLLSLANLQRIMESLRALVDFDENCEISLETTPHAITEEKARAWKSMGINRVSIGIESLLNDELTAIGRDHSVEQALAGIEIAGESGIPLLSIDFMYGLPTQTLDSFGATLDRAIELTRRWPAIGHISSYCLELSVNSALKSRFPDGHPSYPSEDTQVAMYHLLVEKLAAADFQQYEVSNFARSGHQCRHNLTYWRNRSYFAFGVGAHRYVDGVRSSNSRSFNKYLRDPFADDVHEVIDSATEAKEALMLGLRMMAGVDLTALLRDFGLDLLQTRAKELQMFEKEGLVQLSDGKLRLTQSGVPISNSIIATLL
ncbi:MAG: radical SAM family heme chaperone HemW [Cyanobacteria bacterium SZAS LIN-2]|nr:radical SAM family heme chaperone HemW [Cyanobacteria bacterium SZAS LIN-2]